MILSEEQYDALFGLNKGRSYGAYNSLFKPWTSKVIPYEFQPYHFTEEQTRKILEGMRVWEGLTCIRFREKAWRDVNWIHIFSGPGCFSQLSMKEGTGSQGLSLSPGCYWRGTVEHELGHAIGLVHEHQRPTRDRYLGVNMQNVQYFALGQLQPYETKEANKMGLPYDYFSVMHYGQHAFAYTPTAQTLFAIDANRNRRPDITEKLGRVMGPSFLDVQLVNMMYECSAHCQNPPTCRPDCFVDKNCKCFCEKDMLPVPCTDHRRDCAQRAADDLCNHPDPSVRMDMGNFCRKTCGVCAVGDTRLPPKKPKKPVVKEKVCKDKASNCPAWAKVGECQNNPSYMLLNCRRSCKVCQSKEPLTTTTTTPRPTTTTEALACEDKNSSCQGWAAAGHCSKNPGYMLKKCRKACGECTDFVLEKCENENPSCDEWARFNQCSENPGYMTVYCRKACRLC